jgi:galactokinase
MEHLHRAGDEATRVHRTAFRTTPRSLAAAPGRVNLIGEHVDHAGGPVLPLAIDRAIAVAAGPGTAGTVRIVSDHFGRVDLDAAGRTAADGPAWARAILAAAADAGRDVAGEGLDVSIAGAVPPGAGLSSSAALLVAAVLAFGRGRGRGRGRDPAGIAATARRLEHAFLGVPCGPMDQLASVHGRAGHALLIDCRPEAALEAPPAIPLPAHGFALTFVDTGLRHRLADGRYAARRADLARAAAALGVAPGDWNAAAESPPDLRTLARRDPPAAARARHVITEIRRTHAAAAALRAGDAHGFGALLDASHASLRDDFDASVPGVEAIRTIVRHALGPALLGCRMVGGGWGGGVLCLTRTPPTADPVAVIRRRGAAATGRPPRILPVRAADGARILEPPRDQP